MFTEIAHFSIKVGFFPFQNWYLGQNDFIAEENDEDPTQRFILVL